MFVPRRTKIWLTAACLAAVLACAEGGPANAQVSSSEYAPLPGAPKPGERTGSDLRPAIEPQAATTPTSPEASTPKAPEPAPTPSAVAVAPSSPEPVTPSPPEPTAPTPPAVSTTPAEAPPVASTPAIQPQPTAAEKAAEKKKAVQEKTAKKEKETKGERSASTDTSDDALPRGRVPEDGTLKNAAKLPADDKGPRALNFIGNCLNNYDNCMQFVREQAEKIPKSDVCFPEGVDQVDITEKVRKFITLRPAIHSQAANRVVTEALYGIYPCKRAATPARTAGAPKGAKATQ